MKRLQHACCSRGQSITTCLAVSHCAPQLQASVGKSGTRCLQMKAASPILPVRTCVRMLLGAFDKPARSRRADRYGILSGFQLSPSPGSGSNSWVCGGGCLSSCGVISLVALKSNTTPTVQRRPPRLCGLPRSSTDAIRISRTQCNCEELRETLVRFGGSTPVPRQCGRGGRDDGAGYSTPAAFSSGGGEKTEGSHCGPPTTYSKEGPAPETTPRGNYFGCRSLWEGLRGRGETEAE